MADPKRILRILQRLNRGLIVWCLAWAVRDALVGQWLWVGFQLAVMVVPIWSLRRNRRTMEVIRRFEAWAAMREKARWN